MDRLEEIKNKVNARERLSRKDGIYLYQSNDLLAIGEMAKAKKTISLRAPGLFQCKPPHKSY